MSEQIREAGEDTTVAMKTQELLAELERLLPSPEIGDVEVGDKVQQMYDHLRSLSREAREQGILAFTRLLVGTYGPLSDETREELQTGIEAVVREGVEGPTDGWEEELSELPPPLGSSRHVSVRFASVLTDEHGERVPSEMALQYEVEGAIRSILAYRKAGRGRMLVQELLLLEDEDRPNLDFINGVLAKLDDAQATESELRAYLRETLGLRILQRAKQEEAVST